MTRDTMALINRAKKDNMFCTDCGRKKNDAMVRRIRYLKRMKWFWGLNQLEQLCAVEKLNCPKCGSSHTTKVLSFSDSVPLPRENFISKTINPTFHINRGKTKAGDLKKPIHEYHDGASPVKDAKLRKKIGDYIHLTRIIDLENDRYYEKCTTEQGVVLRECDEKLTEHQGRGSAKLKK
jgi:hypothetical protein